MEFKGTGSFVWGALVNYGKLWRFVAENMTSEFTQIIGGRYADHIEIDIPKAVGCRLHGGTNENVVQAFWNVPSATTLGTGGYQPKSGNTWFGNVNGPECLTIDGICVPNKSGANTTYTLPKLTTINQWSFWNLGEAAGTLDLYIGPNLTNIHNDAKNRLVSATNISVHIPAGDTTTKATLDAAGVAYTQDYII
jgi:hypothetical protein